MEAPVATVVLRTAFAGGRLLQAVERAAAIRWQRLRIVVLENGETEPLVDAALARLESLAEPDVKVIRAGVGTADSRYAEALAYGEPGLVVLADAAACFSVDFIQDALAAMAGNPRISMATGQQATTSGDLERSHQDTATFEGYWIVHGEARASIFYENRASGGLMVLRAPLAAALPSMADGAAADVWRAMLAGVAQGIRCVVASEVVAVHDTRHVEARMLKDPRAGYHQLLSGHALTFGESHIPLYAIEIGAQLKGGADHDVTALEAQLAELRSSEAVRVALGVVRRIDRYAPWMLPLMRGVASRVLKR
jgi:hypothetical protein